MNKKFEDTILIICDCCEEDFFIFEKMYGKLAKRNGFNLENVLIITDKTIKNYKSKEYGYIIDKDFVFAKNYVNAIRRYKQNCLVLARLSNKDRLVSKLVDSDFISQNLCIQYFGNEEEIDAEIEVNGIADDIVSIDTVVPNKEYFCRLNLALKILIDKIGGK